MLLMIELSHILAYLALFSYHLFCLESYSAVERPHLDGLSLHAILSHLCALYGAGTL